MNKRLRRTVGTVGVAGGMLLLGAGVAHADTTPSLLGDLQQQNLGPSWDWNGGNTFSADTTGNALPTDQFRHSAFGDISSLTGATKSARSGPVDVLPATSADESMPTIGGLPITQSNLPVLTGQGLPSLPQSPVNGTLKPVSDVGIPLGSVPPATSTEATSVPLLGSVPVVGGVGQNNAIQGLPAPQDLPIVGTYQARHSAGESAGPEDLPLVGGGLPLVGSLPLIGSLL